MGVRSKRQIKDKTPKPSMRSARQEATLGVCRDVCAGRAYFRTASLKAFAARRRTTVLALILIASPVAGLRPMRALRCAFTARPMPGITNFPAPLASFTASLNSSSKNDAICFFDTGLSVVLTLSARWAMILDLLNGVAIEFSFLLSVITDVSCQHRRCRVAL